MTYLRIYTRGHWLTVVHITSNAGIRTLCGRMVSGFQAETELSAEKPEGRICQQCQQELAERGETAWR